MSQIGLYTIEKLSFRHNCCLNVMIGLGFQSDDKIFLSKNGILIPD